MIGELALASLGEKRPKPFGAPARAVGFLSASAWKSLACLLNRFDCRELPAEPYFESKEKSWFLLFEGPLFMI